jgi:hypothetical protein
VKGKDLKMQEAQRQEGKEMKNRLTKAMGKTIL